MAFVDSPRDNVYNGGMGGSGAGWVLAGLVGGAVLGKLWSGHSHGGFGCGIPTAASCPATESSVAAGTLQNSIGTGNILQSIIENARVTSTSVVTDAAARSEAVTNILGKLGDGQVALAGGIRELACRLDNSVLTTVGAVKDANVGIAADLAQRFNCLNQMLTGTFNNEACKLDKIIDLLSAAPAAAAAMAQQNAMIESLKTQVAVLSASKAA